MLSEAIKGYQSLCEGSDSAVQGSSFQYLEAKLSWSNIVGS